MKNKKSFIDRILAESLLGTIGVVFALSWMAGPSTVQSLTVDPSGSSTGSPWPSPTPDPCLDPNVPGCRESRPHAEFAPVGEALLSGANATIDLTGSRLPGNHPPQAVSSSLSTAIDTPVTITLNGADEDEDALQFELRVYPRHGTLSVTGDEVTYAPDAGFEGSDAFLYSVTDGLLNGLAVVSIQVGSGSNGVPVVTNLDRNLVFGQTTSIPIVVSDPESDPTTVVLDSSVTRGQAVLSGGTVNYNPGLVFGHDQFAVVVDETSGGLQRAIFVARAVVADPSATTTLYDGDPDAGGTSLTDPQSGYGALGFTGINTLGLSDGVHTITAKIVDASGDSGVSTQDFTVDNTPPTLEWVTKPVGPFLSGMANFTLNPQDNVSVRHVAMTLDGNSNPIDYLDQLEAYSTSYNTAGLTDGAHTFTFAAVDAVGLVSLPLSATYTVDHTPPLADLYFNGILINPHSNVDANGTITVVVRATESVSGMKSISVLKPGQSMPDAGCFVSGLSGATAQLSCGWDTSMLAPGSHVLTVQLTNQAGLTDNMLVSVSHASNQAPVLTSPGNQSVGEGQMLTFTLPAAVDPDGNALTYSASNVPSGAFFNPTTRVFSWTPDYNQAGTYANVTFTVVDNGVPPLNDSKAISITVSNVNRKPALASPGNKNVSEGEGLFFTLAAATDPDGDGLTYAAGNLPSGATFDPATRVFSWTPTFTQSGGYDNVTFTATDNGTPNLSDTQTISISVINVNRPPVLPSPGNKTVLEGQPLTFQLSPATDADGDTVTYSAVNLPLGASFDSVTRTFSWTPSYSQAGAYPTLTFTAMDAGTPAQSDSKIITITVANENRAPIWTSIGNQSASEGQLFTLTLTEALDPDGDALTYAVSNLPSGASFDPVTRVFSWMPTYSQSGTYSNVTFQVVDAGIPAMSAQESISITVGNVNQAPVLQSVGNKAVLETNLLTFAVNAMDADGDNLTFSSTNLPAGALFDPGTRTFSWTPGPTDAGDYTVSFTVTDNGVPNLSDGETITISVGSVNQAPSWSSPGNQSVNEGQLLSFTVPAATDPDGDALTYSASNLPNGATFDPATRVLAWTPGYAQAGSYTNVVFTVTDSGTPHLSASNALSITVANINRAPVLTTPGDKNTTENQLLTFTLPVASDPDSDALTYSASNLPNGATFDPVTRVFSWTPGYNQSGIYSNVTFSATDNGSPVLADSKSISITVANSNRVPVLQAIGNKNGDENALLSFTVSATDADGDGLTYSASNLPSGAAFDPATRVFAWTPTYSQSGTYLNVVFQVIDGGTPAMSAQESISIAVANINRTPALASPGNKTVAEGQPLSFTLSPATDPDGDAMAYTASNLPSLAMFDPATRTFSWTPSESQDGVVSIGFQATDNGTPPKSAQQTIQVTVTEVNSAPALEPISDKFVSGPVALAVTAGDTDFPTNTLTYSLVQGPTGAVVNSASGLFTWAPTVGQNGLFQVQVRATDNGTPVLSDTKSFNITVDRTNPSVQIITPNPSATVSGVISIQTDVMEEYLNDVKIILDTTVLAVFSEPPFPTRFSWSLDTRGFANGGHIIRVLATNKAGNTTQSNRNITIANEVPTVAITNTNLAYVRRSNSTVIIATTTGQVDHVNLLINGIAQSMTSAGGGQYQYVWDTLAIPTGSYQLEAIAYGPEPLYNPSAPSRITSVLDGQLPTVNIDLPTPAQATTGLFGVQRFRVTTTDDNLVDHIEFWFGNVRKAIATPDAATGVFTGEFLLDTQAGDTPDGTYSFTAKAFDKAGYENSKMLSFSVNNTNPPVSEASIDEHPDDGSFVTTAEDARITLTFDKDLDPNSYDDNSILVKAVKDGQTSTLTGTVGRIGRTLTFSQIVPANSQVTVDLVGVRDVDQKLLSKRFKFYRMVDKTVGGVASLQQNNGQFELTLPPGGLPEDMFVAIEPADSANMPSLGRASLTAQEEGQNTLAGPFKVYGKNAGQPELYALAQTAQLTYFELSPSPLPEEQNRTVQIQRFDGNVWRPIGTSTLIQTRDASPGARSVSVPISSLGTFRVNSVPVPAAGIDGLFCYPNPFNPKAERTNIQYSLSGNSDVTLVITDLFGNLVRTQRYGAGQNGGQVNNTVDWDGRNGQGDVVGNGGYILQLVTQDGQGNTGKATYKVGVVK